MVPRDRAPKTLLLWLGFGLVISTILFGAGCNASKMGATPPPPAAGILSASNSTLSFGSVQLGTTKSMPLVLSNTGSQGTTVQVSQLAVSGSGFNASGATMPLTLSAGQQVTLTVSFTPSASGSASGDVGILSNASNASLTVPLSGTGTSSPAGQLAVSPASLSFGTVNVGSSKSLTGTLSASSSNVTVSSASWNGTGFSVSGITFPVSIPAGQSASFSVTFTPQSSGSANGSVSFLSNASNSPGTEQWTGTGAQPTQHSVALSWNPDPGTVQGYYVYRGGQSGGPYSKISALQSATAYVDTNVTSGQTYYYVVTALGTNSVESGYSNEAPATIP